MNPPDTGLPVEASVAEVRTALADQGAAVLVAPPGSGKTTVVPLRLLDEEWRQGRKIVVLEPRRLATRAAARRMATLLGESLGQTVGYVTRTDRETGPDIAIEVVTEGVLTRRLQTDPGLTDTAAVIFDEIHERNLQTDLGLALALHTRGLFRPDLRLLAMSATVDAARISAVVAGPVIESDARTYPVDMRWRPAPRHGHIEPHVATVIREALRTDEGDILCFLPGMAQIDRVSRHLDDVDAEVHRLHGSLPLDDQDRAISPGRQRKVVLSTDIAESSLTVEGVSVVVDSGLARSPRFDARTGMSRLTTIGISKASADQRAGRAGRLGPGVAYRLWSKMEHAARKTDIEPEILTVDLAGFFLDMVHFGVDDPKTLIWLDPPPARAVSEAVDLLVSLGAIDADRRLTNTGRAMARLPLHPRLARMVADAGTHGWTACLVAALVDDRDLFGGPLDERPVDLALRVRAVVDGDHRADRRGAERVLRTAQDLASRARIDESDVNIDRVGPLLALAFPDRLAIRRGSPGRFQLRLGATAWVPSTDPLAPEAFLVAADLDGKRKDARIRLAAGIDADEVVFAFADEIDERTEVVWESDRLVERTERKLGGIVLESFERRARPDDRTRAMVLDRIRSDPNVLVWVTAAVAFVERVAFLHRSEPGSWPDWTVESLTRDAGSWLEGWITAATSLDEVRQADVLAALRNSLGHDAARRVDQEAPTTVKLPSGRDVKVDYSGERPSIAARVQEFYGSDVTPQVGGRRLVLELLSPAQRPVQITDDLAGFWKGSWAEVRKEMAGRYPKHNWPENPAET
ncbi:MAG TPA: ATP-dependent helicase HrpB [Acidimicrobiia bacterium]|nr:ATP-dependent helicase HrpB [Acidimicrobiia bacterium]